MQIRRAILRHVLVEPIFEGGTAWQPAGTILSARLGFHDRHVRLPEMGIRSLVELPRPNPAGPNEMGALPGGRFAIDVDRAAAPLTSARFNSAAT
jgi:hypothetical protein